MTSKIKGPGGPVGPGDVGDVAPTDKPKGTGFADKLGEPGEPGGPSEPGQVKTDAVGAIAADLKAGKLTPQQALDKLVDLTINQGPAARLPDAVKAKLRAELETLLKDDPMLAGKAKRAGLGEEP